MTARSRALAALFVSTMAALSSDRAVAQFDQYRAPGGPQERPIARKESLEQAIEDARWQVGRVRLAPWLGVSNVEYVDNAFGVPDDAGEKVSDITATAGAGLRAYLPSGPKLIWAGHALPEYTWWQDLEDRRGVNGRYGLGLFGFLNRLTFEATAARDQMQRVATPEIPQALRNRVDRAGLAVELEATRRIALFAAGEQLEMRHRLAGERDPRTAPLDQLDRDQTLLRGGLRYRFPGGWSLGAGVESSEVEFTAAVGAADRSNSGTSPFLELRRDGRNDYLRVEVARRSLDPEGGSSFQPYEATTAAFEIGANTAGRLVTWFYGSRNLVYSLAAGYSDLQDDRVGLALERELGWRTRLRVYGEAGRNDYRPAVPGVDDREDETRAYGASFNFKVGEASSFTLSVTRSELDSNLPGLDRTVTSIGTGLNFGGRRTSWY